MATTDLRIHLSHPVTGQTATVTPVAGPTLRSAVHVDGTLVRTDPLPANEAAWELIFGGFWVTQVEVLAPA